MSIGRAIVIGVVLIGMVVAWSKYARAQDRPERGRPMRSRVSLAYIEDKAREARSGKPEVVRAYTDELFLRTPFAEAAPSLKDRLFRSEQAFRNGTQRSISEQEFVAALNEQLQPVQSRIANGHAILRTTPAQVRKFRESMKFFIPHLSHTRRDEPVTGKIESEMAPSEAVFVAMQLVAQKLINPSYQVSPEEWVATVERQKTEHAQRRANSRLPEEDKATFTVISRPTALAAEGLNTADAVGREIATESSQLVTAAHAFLDRLGIQR